MTEEASASPRTRPVGSCPVCGRPGAESLFSAGDRFHGVPGTYHYGRCATCGTVYQDPRVADEDLPRLYPQAYYTHAPTVAPVAPASPGKGRGGGVRDRVRDVVRGITAPSAEEPPRRHGLGGLLLSRSRWLRERAFGDLVLDELLPWKTPPGRALDVGCGAGALMRRLARVGWQVEGAEWDREAARVAREATGLPVHAGGAEALPPSLGPFDLVVLSHVLEHFADPVQALAALRRLLSSEGRIVVIYPNPCALLARRFGAAWVAWDPPRHLTLPPARALRVAGERAGLELRRVRTLSRWGARHAFQSRAIRRGRPPDPPAPTAADRMWERAEALAVALGAPLGEEVAGVLHRAGGASGAAAQGPR